MARLEVTLGSQGTGVKDLQKYLNNYGYKLDVDGIFGLKTLDAVRNYQQKNGLTVDGIVGHDTWASLIGATGGTPSSGATSGATSGGDKTTSTEPFKYKDFEYDDFKYGDFKYGDFEYGDFKHDDFEYDKYEESDTVKNAEAALNAQLAQKPGAYQSQWQSQLDDTINKILNREKFSYDLNGDALYQQYKDKYIQQGKMAMGDAIGQASAMTGGYGNSYAQSVGQQQYQASLENLNDIVPELYQMAYDKYNQEGQDLYNQYSMLGAQEEQDYGRYRDSVSDWQSERDYLAGRYDSERDFDYSKYDNERDFAYGQYVDDRNFAYGKYADDRNFAYGKYADDRNFAYGKYADDRTLAYNKYSDDRNLAYDQYSDDKSYAYSEHRKAIEDALDREKFEYQKGRDAIADEQWQKQFDAMYGNKTTDQPMWSDSYTGGNNNTGGNKNTGGSYNNGSLSSSQIKELQKAIGVEADGMYGSASQKAAGGLSAEEAYKKFVGKNGGGSGFTGKTYESAVEYMKSKGVPGGTASGVMTASEWNRRKSSYQAHGTGGTEVKNYSSYQEYLNDFVAYAVETYGR